jgi:hypothetical protein
MEVGLEQRKEMKKTNEAQRCKMKVYRKQMEQTKKKNETLRMIRNKENKQSRKIKLRICKMEVSCEQRKNKNKNLIIQNEGGMGAIGTNEAEK